jgi:type IV pilus assembly protein PilA
MKSELKAKFLQHLAAKKSDNAGFTLIELLVVIIIIGILSAIALPSFLNQANKAKQSEAKTYVGSLNRGQQAYYLEQSGFTSSIDQLGVSIPAETTNYSYEMAVANEGATNENVVVDGESLKPALRAYVGMVHLAQITATSEATTLAALCENNAPGLGTAADPTFTAAAGADAAKVACSDGTKLVGS